MGASVHHGQRRAGLLVVDGHHQRRPVVLIARVDVGSALEQGA